MSAILGSIGPILGALGGVGALGGGRAVVIGQVLSNLPAWILEVERLRGAGNGTDKKASVFTIIRAIFSVVAHLNLLDERTERLFSKQIDLIVEYFNEAGDLPKPAPLSLKEPNPRP